MLLLWVGLFLSKAPKVSQEFGKKAFSTKWVLEKDWIFLQNNFHYHLRNSRSKHVAFLGNLKVIDFRQLEPWRRSSSMPSTDTAIAMIYLEQESFSVYITLILTKKRGGNQILHLYPVSSTGGITWERNFASLPHLESAKECKVWVVRLSSPPHFGTYLTVRVIWWNRGRSQPWGVSSSMTNSS